MQCRTGAATTLPTAISRSCWSPVVFLLFDVCLTLSSIYTLEKQIHSKTQAVPDHESSPLLTGSIEDVDKTFESHLDHELEKICSFYQLKELEIYGEMDEMLRDEAAFEAEQETMEDLIDDHEAGPLGRRVTVAASGRPRSGSIFKSFSLGNKKRRTSTMSARSAREDDDDSDEADERAALTRSKTADTVHYDDARSDFRSSRRRASMAFDDYNDMSFSVLYDSSISLKKRLVSIYVSLCELRSFIQLNRTGFTKVLKKFDKILDRKLKSSYIAESVEPSYPFQKSTMNTLNENIEKLEQTYATLVTQGSLEESKRELRLHLREHVVWERNTVWREMIGIERKTQAANMGIRQTMLGRETDPSKARLLGDEAEIEMKEIQTPVGKYRCPSWLFSPTLYTLITISSIFFILLFLPLMELPEQQNCLALVAFVSLLWATEAIPLFVTSLLVPFLAVVLRVVRSDQKPHNRLDSKSAANYVFAAMWTPVIMLLLGGFTIAAALSKYNIAKMMATFVLSKAGTRPRTVLLTTMFVAMFASMWISNVAAPVLCYSIVQASKIHPLS
jgi:phosphate transporter